MSRLDEIKERLDSVGPTHRADLFWAVEEIERLREIIREGCEIVKECGHGDTCRCCWCKLRILWTKAAAQAAKGKKKAVIKILKKALWEITSPNIDANAMRRIAANASKAAKAAGGKP